ncbi:hypothetical protein EYF80_045784 [Liparis tanakae]|uniref:Uncharacterized protein n=1 Tax=Liparis tanakae TaxID=230148 RepID=A0A4Z2FS78_9TELE|nr:hypothetical protein EYF80_045784 [Liparis tanakae]
MQCFTLMESVNVSSGNTSHNNGLWLRGAVVTLHRCQLVQPQSHRSTNQTRITALHEQQASGLWASVWDKMAVRGIESFCASP